VPPAADRHEADDSAVAFAAADVRVATHPDGDGADGPDVAQPDHGAPAVDPGAPWLLRLRRLRTGDDPADLAGERPRDGRRGRPWVPGALSDLLRTHERSPRSAAGSPLAGAAGSPRARTAPAGYGFVDDVDTREPPDALAPPAAAGARRWGPRWRPPRVATPFAGRVEQRSLFGEILDWMFAPLLLLWPLSVAVTFVVARSLADAPFDRALDDRTEALGSRCCTSRRIGSRRSCRAPRTCWPTRRTSSTSRWSPRTGASSPASTTCRRRACTTSRSTGG
jgi:hypothetical protein